MKKLFAMVLALCLLACSAFAADYTWDGVLANELSSLNAEGHFYTLNAAPIRYWLPDSVSTYVEPTEDEQQNEHLVASYYNDDKSRVVLIEYAETSYATPDDILAEVNKDSKYTNVSSDTVNGLTAVTYMDEENGACFALYLLGDGNALQLKIGGFPEDERLLAAAICWSIMPAEQQ